jgi:hypothetical protein
MAELDVDQLRREATRVRRAVEAVERPEHSAGNLAQFPKECCDHATKLLALHLSRLGLDNLQKAKGQQGAWPDAKYHVWLHWQGVTLDITADQFGEGQPDIVVIRQSPWHDRWKPTLEAVDLEHLTVLCNGPQSVFRLYREILAALDPKACE